MGSFRTRKPPSHSGARGVAVPKLAFHELLRAVSSVCQVTLFTPPNIAGCLNRHTATARLFLLSKSMQVYRRCAANSSKVLSKCFQSDSPAF